MAWYATCLPFALGSVAVAAAAWGLGPPFSSRAAGVKRLPSASSSVDRLCAWRRGGRRRTAVRAAGRRQVRAASRRRPRLGACCRLAAPVVPSTGAVSTWCEARGRCRAAAAAGSWNSAAAWRQGVQQLRKLPGSFRGRSAGRLPAAGPRRYKEYQLALEAAAAAASAGAEAGSLGVLALVCACVRRRLVTVSPPWRCGGSLVSWPRKECAVARRGLVTRCLRH